MDATQEAQEPPKCVAVSAGQKQHNNDASGNRKREMKPHSKQNRKRSRDAIADAENELEVEVLPLVIGTSTNACMAEAKGEAGRSTWSVAKRIRVVKPYPFTFATFSKARWKGQSIIDVYHKEFGSYPRSYYESAINEGRILVSGDRVSCDYKIKGGDELTHTVHRHEPAVMVADGTLLSFEGKDNTSSSMTPLIKVLHQDEAVIVVDKPSTLPIHPCGGYNFNSLFHLLSAQDPSLKGRLHTIHRLDRLTSGLTIIAKNKDVAKKLGQCIRDREHCQKVYLARVRGKFPLQASAAKRLSWSNNQSPCQYGETDDGKLLLGYWIADCSGTIQHNAMLSDVFESKRPTDSLISELDTHNESSIIDKESNNKLWFHLACPCRIKSHKNGVCEAGDFLNLDNEEAKKVKPAQTSFAVVSYDERSDTTIVLVKPETGRMHQIRLHCQYLHHPIANDSNYGGELWYDDPAADLACQEARKEMSDIDREQSTTDRPDDAISTNVPATEAEIANTAKKPRAEGEPLLDFIKKTCVWCARSRGCDRTMLEFLVRSRGIWLHALRYSLIIDGDNEDQKKLCYRTDPPAWASFDRD